MASISEDTDEETPLQIGLNGVATFIGIVGLSIAVSVLAVLLGRYFSGNTTDPNGSVQFVAGRTAASHAVKAQDQLTKLRGQLQLPVLIQLLCAGINRQFNFLLMLGCSLWLSLR